MTLKLVPGGSSAESPFDALLRAAERDPSAAEGLALAYANLDLEERSALVETIVRDARAAERSPAGTLALLLGVESDRELAHRIAAALIDESPAHLARRRGDAGWGWGGEHEGGIAVARHLHGAFFEVLAVKWCAEAFALEAEPLATHEHLSDVRARLGVPESADTLGLDEAVDRLAAVLWRARRRAPLPETLRGLAHLFEPYD